MRKWVIGGSVLLVLCVALLIAVLNINSYVQRNRDYLINQAEKALGRRISAANIEVSIWNGIGFRLENFVIADDPAFSSGDFVRANALQVNVKLVPLLRQDVQVKRLVLNQPAINIIRNKEGIYNFSTIGRTDNKKDEQSADDKDSAAQESQKRAAFLISLIDISEGEVRYRELGDGTDLLVRQVDLEVRDLDFNRPFSVDLAAALFAPNQNVKINTIIGPISSESDFRKVSLDGKIDIDSLDVNQLQNALPKLKTALPKDLDFDGVFRVNGLKVKGTIENLTINGGLEGTNGIIRYGESFHKAAGIPLAVSTDAQYSADEIVLRTTTVRLHTLPLTTSGEITLGNRPALNLSLNSEPASLDGWEKLIPALTGYNLKGKVEVIAELRGPVGDGNIPQIQGNLTLQDSSATIPQLPKPIENMNAQIAFSGQRAELKETTLSLGNSSIRLSALIDRFSPLTLSYKLSASQLAAADLQSSLPEQRKNDVLRNVSSNGQLTTLNGITTVRGTVVSSDGNLYSLSYKNLDANLSYNNEVATLRDLRANVLNGALQMMGEYAFDKIPRFSVSWDVKTIDLVQLYRYFNPQSQPDVRGNLSTNLKLAGHGDQWKEIQTTLRGQGQAEVLHGALLNFNIADAVLSGTTGIPGLANLINPAVRRKYPETFEARDTEFKELQTQLEIGNARVNFKNVHMAAAQFKIEGSGWADFDRRVNFRGVVRFSPALSADIAAAVREIRFLFNKNNELEIPFTLTGEMPHVRPRPDASYLTKALQRGLLQRGAEELQEQLFGTRQRSAPNNRASEENQEQRKGSPEDLIRRGLEGLFGRQKNSK